MMIKPLITEKSMVAAALNCYTFKVGKKVSKGQIKEAVEKKFKVNVIGVRSINVKKAKQWKKAFVEIKKGQKITGFEVEHEK